MQTMYDMTLGGHVSVFFFQAEDGIRDLTVTGVQTCALPIYAGPGDSDEAEGNHRERDRAECLRQGAAEDRSHDEPGSEDDRVNSERGSRHGVQIGRASCRERV